MTYRILIVEDEADIALPLAANLKDDGFFAEIACSAEVARQKLTHHWDLIILDLMLPDLGGEVFLNYLKQEPEVRDIPDVPLTPLVPIVPEEPLKPEDALKAL